MNSTQVRNPHTRALVMITSLFFLFGFITCLNDILVPHLKQLFTLTYTQAILIQFAFFSSYFVVSIPSSKFCENHGYQRGLFTGLAITAIGAFGFLGSAHFASFNLFLCAFFVLAAGITLIQVAANPYVTLLGSPETASARLTIVQAFNSLGTTAAPLVGSYFILSNQSVSSVEVPYVVIGFSLVALAVFIALVKLPSFKEAQSAENVPWSELFANKRLVMGMFGIFAYVGAEVAIGSFLINYLGTPQVMSFSPEIAGRYVSIYWGGAMIGRFVGTPLLAKYRPASVLQFVATGAIALIVFSVLGSGEFAMATILAVGFFNSIMFPTIFSQSIYGLERGTEKASGLLCMSIVGGALVPLLQGVLADQFELRYSFFLPVICYGYIWIFAAYLRSMKMNFKSPFLLVVGIVFTVVTLTGCDPVPRRTLTQEEKAADLAWVYSQFGENYAPLEYKQKRFGFDFEQLKLETNDAAKAATTNDEFYGVVFKFVSMFRDAHSSAALTNASLPNRAMVAYLGFSGVRDGETLLVKNRLPTITADSPYPIKKDDRILKLNGRFLRDVVNSDLLRWRDLGNDEANFTYHANKLFTHVSTSNGIPSESEVVLTVKRGDMVFDVTLPWVKKDLVQFTAEQDKAKKAALPEKAASAPENYLMLGDDSGGVLLKFQFIGFDGRIELPVLNAEMISRKFRKNVNDSFRMVDSFAGWKFLSADAESSDAKTPEAVMRAQRHVPDDAVFLTAAKVYPAYIAREKLFDEKGVNTGNTALVGTVYIDTFNPLETPKNTLAEFKATLANFQLLGVEFVILDLINNGGGQLTLGMQMAQALSNEKIELPKIQLRTSDSWMDQFESDALEAASDSEREVSRRVFEDLSGARRSGSRLSAVYSAEVLGPFLFEPNPKIMKKMKIAVLINEMCASMCDIFSANLQDNKMAIVVGTQSMGAGGNVVGYNQAPNSHFDIRQTESLVIRKDGSYLENAGTLPDVIIPVASFVGTKYKEVHAAAVKALLSR